jgi:hypothetical protein
MTLLKAPCVALECNLLVVLISYYIVGYLVYFNTNCKFTGFWILSALLTPLLVLKTISRKYSDYRNAGYRSVDFVFALFLHLHFLSTCLCSCVFLQQYLQWKSSKY